jgi:hypothetical protein
MSVPEVARHWGVRFSFSTGSAPGCKIGGFSREGVVGGALFQNGKFDAAWFTRGVRPLYYVRGGKAHLLLEFWPKRSGEIADIGFGNGFVLAQEGCN